MYVQAPYLTCLNGNQFIWGHTRLESVSFEMFLQDVTLQMLMNQIFNSGGHTRLVRNSDFSLVLFSPGRHRENYDKLSVKCDIQLNVAMKCVSLEFNQACKPVYHCNLGLVVVKSIQNVFLLYLNTCQSSFA